MPATLESVCRKQIRKGYLESALILADWYEETGNPLAKSLRKLLQQTQRGIEWAWHCNRSKKTKWTVRWESVAAWLVHYRIRICHLLDLSTKLPTPAKAKKEGKRKTRYLYEINVGLLKFWGCVDKPDTSETEIEENSEKAENTVDTAETAE